MILEETLDKFKNIDFPGGLPVLQIIFFLLILYLLVLVIWFAFRYSTRQKLSENIARLDQRIAEAETDAEENRENNRPIWELNYYQLVRFIEINREQNSRVFRLSIQMIVFGLLLICAGLARDFLSAPELQHTGVSWAAIIAGLVTQFIAATILVLFRSVVQQTMEYFKTVERMASIGIAINILDNLPKEADAQNVKSKTLSDIAVKVIERQLGVLNFSDDSTMAEIGKKL